MSSGRQQVTVRDLVDEAKKRIVFLFMCGVGLSYLMSLTSTSVLINLPAALILIIAFRYFTLDYENRRKAASYSKNQSADNVLSQKKPFSEPKPLSGKSDWRRKVNSPVVEDAIDQFTKHIVSEWVTDLWYSKITPDKQGPDELVLIINGVLGEFSSRMRNINLIDLLTRDILKLFCTHLELFRACQMKIMKQESLTIAQRDIELKAVLYAENKLHPALFSAGAEYKVLQHLMDGFISFTFRPADLQCSLFRYIVREILACTVIRPVVNLANPRFINERIENVVISASKNNKGANTEQVNSQSKSNGSPKMSTQLSMSVDPSVKGLELAPLKKENSDSALDNVSTATHHSKDPLLSMDTRKHLSGGEWGDKYIISRRKTEALAPENMENKMKKRGKHVSTGRKRSRVSSQKDVWEEIERKTFVLEDGHDVLGLIKGNSKSGDSSGDSENGESLGRTNSGMSTSSIFPLNSSVNAQKGSPLDGSFFRLRCEVLGANIVKSGSKTFAVYPISVTDVNNVNWSIKRRFRHFEELHRRLKEYPEYNLHLPPKHFLSTGLDVDVIQERCKLLDIYLKRLMQFPTISGCIEVWDFLSVDSQTYSFSNSISIIETLPVSSATSVHEKSTDVRIVGDPLSSKRELSDAAIKNSLSETKHNYLNDGSKVSAKNVNFSLGKPVKPSEDSDSDPDIVAPNNISSRKLEDDKLHVPSEMLTDDGDSVFPSEWVPPNLSIPILDLVDVVFQLQDGGWVRRKAFWVAKQVLQLGMSDAFDDWLIAKIQLLRRGSIVASGIKRLEQILWPDGIFITKHPKRQQPTPSPKVTHDSRNVQPSYSPSGEETLSREELQEQEAQRRSKLVYELMIDKAPAAVVSLFGRKQYDQCAKDVYYFIQSSVCLKQFSLDLLELLLMSAFPEMDFVFQQLHDEKHKFGVLEQ
ncbi:putative Phox-associated domain, sorting nexin, PX domain superfamily [Helianthus annuus]|nr:putative Phox-associated domain, sorting nexin, PX domain superfamily [Helianthus annuus]